MFAVFSLFALFSPLSLFGTSPKVEGGEVSMPFESAELDEDLTNARLRTLSGAKGLLSLSLDGSYAGGSLDNPFSDVRPNYRRGLSGVPVFVFTGMSARLRLNTQQSLFLSSGVMMQQPFHGGLKDAESAGRNVFLSSPSLGWNYFSTFQSLQFGLGVITTFRNSEFDRVVGVIGDLNLSLNFTIPGGVGSNWHWGLSGNINQIFYKANPDGQLSRFAEFSSRLGENLAEVNLQDLRKNQDLLSLLLAPSVEYRFSDRVWFRALYAFLNFDQTRNDRNLLQTPNYASVGISFFPARDIWIFPNVQFVPEDARAERTNVSLIFALNFS